MKKYHALILLVALPLGAIAQERVIGVALERYSVIAGGWWLNQKCKFLTGEEAKAFSRDVAVLNTSLATTVDNPNLVIFIQASGKKVSESETYASCPKQAQEIVSYSALAANQWANEVRKIVLEAATRLPGAPK
jgi:hypothetical protein